MLRRLLFPLSAALSIVALCLSTHVAAAPRAAQAGVGDKQKAPVIRSTSRVVNATVVVTDHTGRPLQGLNRDDFQIFDDGQPERIAFFSIPTDDTTESYAVRALAPGEYSNDPHRSLIAGDGATVILFDTVNSTYLSQAYALGKIRVFLRQLQPEDRVGIYVLHENGLKVAYDLNQPASALLGAMQRYDDAHAHRSGSKTSAAENSTGLVELDRFLHGKDDRRPPRCEERFPITFAAFQEIARHTAGFRGRKSVIWVTEHTPLPFREENAFDIARGRFCGMAAYDPNLILEEPANLPPLPGSHRARSVEPSASSSGLKSGSGTTLETVRDKGLSENDELDLVLRLLNQNNIALYPVSAEGLQTVRLFGPGGMDSTAFISDPESMTEAVMGSVDAVANVESHQAMEALARRTGGRAYYNRNDLETGIRHALDDAKYGYELAYYPDHDLWNGDWRKIEVKVNRSGVSVLARGGYYAFPEPKLLPPKARKQLLAEIAASPLEDTEIPITVKLAPPGGAGSSPVEPRVYLSAENLLTSRVPDSWTSDFEVLFFQLTVNNKILDVTTQTVNVDLADAKYREALKRGINTLEKLQLKPGATLLYVIVHDKRTDAVGSVRIPLDKYAATLQRTGSAH